LGPSEIAWTAGVGAAVVVVTLVLSRLAALPIARKVAERGKRVARIRRQWRPRLLVEGLTPLAFVYRVTTVSDEDGQPKATVRLYAYDPGQWLSRHRGNLRQFSGGVWRDA
jgi:hypothetical protein